MPGEYFSARLDSLRALPAALRLHDGGKRVDLVDEVLALEVEEGVHVRVEIEAQRPGSDVLHDRPREQRHQSATG